MVGILINYEEKHSGEIKKTYMEGNDYESVLKKFLLIKGGRDKVSVESIQDWDGQGTSSRENSRSPERIKMELCIR